ncbi:hypothetical protein [Sinomicrobium sp.]
MSNVIIRDQQFVTIGTTEQGPPGKSTYDLAVKAGYAGTLEDWLNDQGVADIAQFQQSVDSLSDDVSGIDARLTTAEGDVDTLQLDISNLQADKFDKGSVLVNTSSTLEANKRYLVDGSIVLTLPSAVVGDTIYLMKQSGTPTINGPILYQNVSDNTLEYDLDVGLSLVFDGTNWRVE